MQNTELKKKATTSRFKAIMGSDEVNALIPLLAMMVIVYLINKNFLTGPNLISMANLAPFVAICCLGNALVIMTGSSDVSVGKTSGLACVMFAWAIKICGLPSWAAVIIGIATGALCGWLNGTIIFDFNLPHFIVTLGMSYVIGALRFLVVNAYPFTDLGEDLEAFAAFKIGPFHMWFYICVILYIVVAILLAKTTIGRQIKAVGDNPEVASLSGINVNKVKKTAYILCGLIVAVAGVLTAIRYDYGNPYTGNGWEFKCMAACAIGGVSLTGGRGSGICIFIGVLTMVILDNAIVMAGISTYLQTTAIGAFLMIAASLDMIRQRKKIKAEA